MSERVSCFRFFGPLFLFDFGDWKNNFTYVDVDSQLFQLCCIVVDELVLVRRRQAANVWMELHDFGFLWKVKTLNQEKNCLGVSY